MNFVSQSFVELARGSRLFVGAVAANTPLSNHELSAGAYVYARLSPSDVVEAMTATPWVSALTWKAINKGAAAETTVVNTQHQVFICMHSPGTVSTSEPTRVDANEVHAADGYVWRYLFTVSPSQHEKFSWSDKTPMSLLPPSPVTTFDVSSLPSKEFDAPRLTFYPPRGLVPSAVVDNHFLTAITAPHGKIPATTRCYVKVEPPETTGFGAVIAIAFEAGVMTASVAAPGTGYGPDVTATVFGNGTGARVSVVSSGGKIVAAQVIEQGIGYAWADAIVTDGVGSGVAPAINIDYDTDLDRKYTLLAKSVPALDLSSTELLDLHFFFAAEAEPSTKVRGSKGSLLVGVDPKTTFHLLSECKPASFRLSQEMLINTLITSG